MSDHRKCSAATLALRELKEGPVDVQLRAEDFNIVDVQGPGGEKQSIPARSLISFSSVMFRELSDGGELSGCWEFRVPEEAPEGGHQTRLIYVSGRDILMVRGLSKVL